MKNTILKTALIRVFTNHILMLTMILIILSSCVSTDPATRYAREHRGREFTSWQHETKKAKKAKKKKAKPARKNKHTW